MAWLILQAPLTFQQQKSSSVSENCAKLIQYYFQARFRKEVLR